MTTSIVAHGSGASAVLQVGGADAVLYTQAGSAETITPLTASVAANALTLGLSALPLQFRSATLSSGAIAKAITAALSLVVPSGATLGTANGLAARLILLVAYNAGAPVLCVVNQAGGTQLDETNLISPTTISAAATSASVIYSSSAVAANSPYRVVGFVDVTQAAAGTWATAPTLVQGAGGQALAALSSLGYGQTWQNVTGSRALGTTYYNTTGKPIGVNFAAQAAAAGTAYMTVGGMQLTGSSWGPSGTGTTYVSAIVPPMQSYLGNSVGSVTAWHELRP